MTVGCYLECAGGGNRDDGYNNGDDGGHCKANVDEADGRPPRQRSSRRTTT